MSSHDPELLHRWNSWIHEHGWKLLAHARQFCRLASDAEDLFQAVVAEFWSDGNVLFPPELPLALARIRQRAIDHVRSERSRSLREGSWQRDTVEDSEQPEFPSDLEHDRTRVQAALDQLPLIFREVVSLKLWSGLTFEQIALLLDLSKNTAASRYRLALEKLRPLLSPTE